jgi:hypothetical protein
LKGRGQISNVKAIARAPLAVEASQLRTKYLLTLRNGLKIRITRLDQSKRNLKQYEAFCRTRPEPLRRVLSRYDKYYLLTLPLPKTPLLAVYPAASLALAISFLDLEEYGPALSLCLPMLFREDFTVFIRGGRWQFPRESVRRALAQAIALKLDPEAAMLLYA